MLSDCNYHYIDLDEPQVDPDSGSDIQYVVCAGQNLNFNSRFRMAPIESVQVSAQDCANRIRSTTSATSFHPVSGKTYCILTEPSSDVSRTQKYVLFHIDAVGQDGGIAVSLTAWNVPN